MCRSADNHKITSNTYYTLLQVFRLCNALSEIIRRGGVPICGIAELAKHGQSRALPLRPIGKTAKNEDNGIERIHGHSQMDIIL